MDGAAESQKVLDLAREHGFDQAGIARLSDIKGADFYSQWLASGHQAGMAYLERGEAARKDPDLLLKGAQTALAVAVSYARPAGEALPMKIARYAIGADYHNVIGRRLRRLAKALQNEFPDARFRPCVDAQPVLEREISHLAGLGWFGKNTMLIDSRRGSWMLLGVILTDLGLAPSEPAAGGCGTCTKCLDACPTGAIVRLQSRWAVDSRKCISWWNIEQRGPIPEHIADNMGEWVFGCDICQEVCPFNAPRGAQPLRAAPATEPRLLQPTDLASMSPEAAAALTEEQWDQISRGSPLRRAGLEGLQRSLKIAEANRTR